ncbi:MAG: TlpA disulfide reductase family protein [Gammaproteobacteria bacterium]
MRIAQSLLILALLGGCAPWPARAGDADLPAVLRLARLPGPVPALRLINHDATRRVTDADFAGRLTLLHFWATWCEPCRHELPALQDLAAAVADARITVVLVAVDEGVAGEAVAAFARGLGVTLPTYLAADGTVPDELWDWGVPVTYLVGTDGAFIGRMRGPRPWRDAALRAALVNLAGTAGRP